MSKNETFAAYRLVCAFDKLIDAENSYLDQCFSYNENAEQTVFAGDLGWSLISIIKSEYQTERKELVRLLGSEIDIFDKVTTEKTFFIVVECSEIEVLEHLGLLMFRPDGSLKTLLLSQEGEIESHGDFPRLDYRAAYPDFYASQVMRFGATYLDSATARKLEAMDDETFYTVRRF